MTARITPAEPPFDPAIDEALTAIMRGKPPLRLFTTVARDQRLFHRFFNGGLLDRGNLTLRQREIVIDRTTALCGSEYEWGVHVTAFAAHVDLGDTELHSLVHGGPDDPCWTDEERLLVEMCDSLHRISSIDDLLWRRLAAAFTDEALIESIMLAGLYTMVSYLTNALSLPLEDDAARFPLPSVASVLD